MRSGMMRCGLVLSLSLQAKIIELRETNKFRTLIFSFHFERVRSEVDRQISISAPKARKHSHSFLPPLNKNCDTVGYPKIG